MLQTMRILWASLASSTAFFLLVLRTHAPEESEAPPHMAEMLGALALGTAVLAVFFPAQQLSRARRAMPAPTREELGEAVGSFRESAPSRRVFENPEQALVDALKRAQTTFIIGMALCESIALLGFVLGFMGEPPAKYLPFFAVALLLMATKFPRTSAVARALERAKGASLT